MLQWKVKICGYVYFQYMSHRFKLFFGAKIEITINKFRMIEDEKTLPSLN